MAEKECKAPLNSSHVPGVQSYQNKEVGVVIDSRSGTTMIASSKKDSTTVMVANGEGVAHSVPSTFVEFTPDAELQKAIAEAAAAVKNCGDFSKAAKLINDMGKPPGQGGPAK